MMFLRHHDICIFHIHIQPGSPPYTPATFHKFTKIHKSAISHPASPYAVAMPHRSPYGPHSHTISLTRRSPRPARALAGLQSTHGGLSRQLASYPPRPGVRFTQTCAPNRFTQIPCTNDGGHRAWRRLATRRRCRSGGLHSSPPEGGLVRPGGADPRGAGAGRIQQNPAGAAPDPQDE